MIAKGNTHDNGARLARYITTGKEGEIAQLWELRGFALRDITEAFRSVHVTAAKGYCRQPFFHVQVRNPEGETLTRGQWDVAINTIERMLGLRDQPRAIAIHTDRKTGHEHIHVAWSRIDPETLSARALPFFKLRLKKVSRELEERFGLTPVPSARRGTIRYAPKRDEEQQARRLGIAINEVREAIRASFEKSDGGRSFQAALNSQGLHLARGEQRDFIVVDCEGGLHPVGKRVLGISAVAIRSRLANLIADELPTVDQIREKVRELRAARLATEHPNERMTKPAVSGRTGERMPNDTSRRNLEGASGKEALGLPRPMVNAPAQLLLAVGNEADAEETPSRLATAEAVLGTKPPSPAKSLRRANVDEMPAGTSHKTPTPSAPSQLGELLKRQFKALVKVLTGTEPAPRPKTRRRREEIGGYFKAAAASLFRWIDRFAIEALPLPWESSEWLHLWQSNGLPTVDLAQAQANPPSSDQSLNP